MCIMVGSFAGVLAVVRRRRGMGKCGKKEDDVVGFQMGPAGENGGRLGAAR